MTVSPQPSHSPRAERVAVRLRETPMTACRCWRSEAPPGDPVGDGAAVVGPDQVQADVEPGGGTRRGQDVAVVDEQHVRVEVDVREQAAEPVGQHPVRGHGPPVQQSRRQGERAGADGDDARPRTDPGQGRAQRRGQLGRDAGRVLFL
ncbi:hypothetical protein [Streptomyces sp. NPDC085659]|uniref:hypothetical protein n=1 Tax=Streptomyces sp. NPDC085659 TaxID=3155177 RepID=UPI00344F9B10